MSKNLDQLLQECLAGLDSGLTPEECLSAWPEERPDLEPMLRQALLLRVAFTAAPGEEFRARARAGLMFAAGREARQALDAEPREAFVRQTRERFLHAAGASAQESLRSVPPPRLAFWVNARRRLLEAASSRRMAPAPQAMAFSFRTGLSAAIVVLAVAVAGLAYFTAQTPRSNVGAELALLEQRVSQVEHKAAAGEPISPAEVVDINLKFAAVAPKITEESQASKAKSLFERQRELTEPVAAAAPEAREAFNLAEQKINQAEVRIYSARADTPRPVTTQPPAGPTNTPQPSPTQPKATSTAPTTTSGATSTPAPLGPNEVRLTFLADDTAWVEVSTASFRMLVPSSWILAGVTFNADHIGKLGASPWIVINAPNNVTIAVNVVSGQMLLSVAGSQDTLRAATGSRAPALTTKELVEKTDALAGQLFYMLQSVVHTPPTPTPTSSPSATPAATQTPTQTPSPAPSASPPATP